MYTLYVYIYIYIHYVCNSGAANFIYYTKTCVTRTYVLIYVCIHVCVYNDKHMKRFIHTHTEVYIQVLTIHTHTEVYIICILYIMCVTRTYVLIYVCIHVCVYNDKHMKQA